MMGFYLAIALLAALTAGNDYAPHSQMSVLKVIWGTTIGLALAHWFAVYVSNRIVDDPDNHHTPGEILISQMLMATGMAFCATIVVLLLPADGERLGARIVAAVFIGGIVAGESRVAGSTWRTTLIRGGIALLAGLAIAFIKWTFGK